MKKPYYFYIVVAFALCFLFIALLNISAGDETKSITKTEKNLDIKEKIDINEEIDINESNNLKVKNVSNDIINYNASFSEEDIKKSIYNGHFEKFYLLYEAERDEEQKYRLELAMYNSQTFNDVFNKVFAKDNPYQPEIYYSKEIEKFKYKDIVYKIVDARAGKSILSEDFRLVKPNVEVVEFAKIMDSSNVTAITPFSEVYKIDIDNDGKDEYVGLFSTNEGQVWCIYEIEGNKIIDKNKENLTDGVHWNNVNIYEYKDTFFLLSEDYIWFYDNGETFEIKLNFLKNGNTYVFQDFYKQLDYIPMSYMVDDALEPTFEKYSGSVGQEIVVTEDIIKGFYGENADINMRDGSVYGRIDFNNDGVMDYTQSYWYSNGNLKVSGEKSVLFFDGKTKEIIDITPKPDDNNMNILTVKPKLIDDKNYFMIQYAVSYPKSEVYIFKFIEFVENKPVVVQETVATTYNNILVELE